MESMMSVSVNDLGCLLVISGPGRNYFPYCRKWNWCVTGLYCVLLVTANKRLTTRSPYVCVTNFSSD